MSAGQSESTPLPRPAMLLIAVTQGQILFGLYRSLENGTWPSESPLFSFPLWTLAVVLPLFLLLSLEQGRQMRVLALGAGFGAILAGLAVYTGYQATPHDAFPITALTAAFALSIAIASFKALMYLQQRASTSPLSYPALFTYSWRNFLVLVLAGLFLLAFWLVLALWAALFKLIGIDFFSQLFAKDWFLFPVLGFALGLGVVIFRELTRVIDSIAALLRGLLKLLLPLVVLVAVIFLLALPFTGLDVLWATGRGTTLMLGLTAVILFFANAVYQDGRDQNPYPAPVHGLIYVGMLSLLPLCALSFYGLALRVDQYGWTVERCWAAVVWLLLALFSLGYVWGIIRRRGRWPLTLAQVNTRMGWSMLALLLLANSPLLDFRKLSLASQLARVESGDIELAALDFYYIRHHLARPGFLALEEIKADIGDSDPELHALIENPLRLAQAQRLQNPDEFWSGVVYRPAGFELPAAVRLLLERDAFVGMEPSRTLLLKVDLDEDGQAEYALLRVLDGRFILGSLVYRSGDAWQQASLQADWRGTAQPDLLAALTTGGIRLVSPRFNDLEVGGVRFQLGPTGPTDALAQATARGVTPAE